MRSLLVLFAALVLLCASRDGCATEPARLPDPFLFDRPVARRYHAVIDAYEFEVFASFFRSGQAHRFLNIVAEGPRPRVGRYPITPWRRGVMGARIYASFGGDHSATYHSVSGELHIRMSTSEGIVGEFEFHGVDLRSRSDTSTATAARSGRSEIGFRQRHGAL